MIFGGYMKAVRIHAFGGPEVLQIDEVGIPELGPGEVLVRIKAASVNPVDYKIRAGQFSRIGTRDLPLTLGRDISGVLEEGARTREVMALLEWQQGGYAEFVVLPRALCILKPRALSMEEAAAVPLAAMTAWQGLFQHGELQSGQRVLIHGGAGGVGHFAVQFAALRGAEVISTASSVDMEFVRSLGAARLIDHRRQRFEDEVEAVDLVLDLVGGEVRDRSWQVLRKGGMLVSTLGPPDELKARELGVRAKGYMTAPNASQLEEIAALLESGKVRAHVAQVFPLEDAGAAQTYAEHQHPRGKVVLAL